MSLALYRSFDRVELVDSDALFEHELGAAVPDGALSGDSGGFYSPQVSRCVTL